VQFLTVGGKIVSVSGEATPLWAPDLAGCSGMRVDERSYFMWKEGDRAMFYTFEEGTYTGCSESASEVPIVGKCDSFMSLKDGMVQLFSATTGEDKILIPLSAPLRTVQKSSSWVDFTMEDGAILSCEFTAFPWAFSEGNFSVPPDTMLWRRLGRVDETMAVAFLSNKGVLSLEGRTVCVLDRDDSIVDFHVVDWQGCVSDSGAFIVIVTRRKVKVYEPNRLRTVRKRSFKRPVVAVQYAPWGALLVQTEAAVEIVAPPDVAASPLGTLRIGPNDHVVLVDGGGLAVISEAALIYDIEGIPPFTPEDMPPLEEAPELIHRRFRAALAVQKAGMTDVDNAFMHKRPAALSDTRDVMQDLLVGAALRGEKLREMQDKAEALLNKAREYKEACRRFRR